MRRKDQVEREWKRIREAREDGDEKGMDGMERTEGREPEGLRPDKTEAG